MKISHISTLILFLSMMLISFESTSSPVQQAAFMSQNEMQKHKHKIHSCEKHIKHKNVAYIVVKLDAKGYPVDALVPILKPGAEIKKLDLSTPKLKLRSIVGSQDCNSEKRNQIISEGHNIHRDTEICFVSAEASAINRSGYKFSAKKIAVLWRPGQETKLKENLVVEEVSAHSPVNIAYKFTIASDKSDPTKCETYLDPRIVIRKR